MTPDKVGPDAVTGPKWDRHYAEPDYIFGTEPNAFLAGEAHRFVSGGRILVPGDGEGRNGVWLAGRGFSVTTIDASTVGVEKARALAALRGVAVNAHCANLGNWAWPLAAFDGVAAIFVHFTPDVRRTLHRRMLDALEPGGILLLEAFTPEHVANRQAGSRGGPPPEMLYTAAVLAADFASAEIECLEEVETTLNEGTRHQGKAAVVRLIVRRKA